MVRDEKIRDFTHVDFYSFEDYYDDECITPEDLFDDKQDMISDIEKRMPHIINARGHWSFDGRAWPAYGFVAASFANLTDGIIFSDSGAWDYSKFPCLADDFLKFYFNINDLSISEHNVIDAKWYFSKIKTYDYIINGKIKTYENVNYDIRDLYVVRLFLDLHYDIKPCRYDSYSYKEYAEINGDTTLLNFFYQYEPMQIDALIDEVNKRKDISAICFIDGSSLFIDENYIKHIKLKLHSLTIASKKNKRNLKTIYLVSGEELLAFN